MSADPSPPPPPASSPAGRDAPPVVIVGAGPVGLALALGLDRHGVRSVVLERGPSTSEHSKAAVIHVRTREVLRQWHVEEPFLAAGTLRSSLTLHAAADNRPLVTFDLAELRNDAEDPGLLVLEQSETERLLLAELQRSARCEVRFGTTFVRLDQHDTHVAVTVSTDRGEQRLDAAFLVGCDGASSTVRDAIGMPFDGLTYGVRPMLADVRVDGRRDDLPWPRQRQGPGGITNAIRLRPGLWRIIRLDDGGRDERRHDDDPAVSDDEVQRRVAEVLGGGPVEVLWAERFRIHRRSSPRFRVGRVVLAGDAAHIHSPLGGLGMNAGIQDAHNLAWKLTAALEGGDIDRLLDSYDVERRAVVVEQVSRTTDRATRVFLQAPARAREHSVRVLPWLLAVAPVRRRGLRTLAMIDLDYPGSPLLDPSDRSAGTRLPDPILLDPDGREVRLHRLLPGAAPLLLEVATTGPGTDGPTQADPAASPAERPVATLRIGPGGHLDDRQVLRGLLGGQDGWILVRADGHIAWAHPGRDRPDDRQIAWSLGADVHRPRYTRPEPRSRTILERARAFRDRTTLDLPHYR
jgi:2-polyprenyl-6-methoxyphenol hydroxylase-like FAD-dependent oxidoreductase